MDARQYFPWCLDQVRAGRIISLARAEEAPPEAARDKEVWRDLGLKSVLTFPLSAGGSPVIGALNFASMREEHEWPDDLVTRLRLVAQIFAGALTRKRADEALRESEARLNLATVGAGVGIWSMDLESLRVWVSPLMREQLLLDPAQEITYQSLLDAVHPADRETVDQAVRHASQTDAHLSVEYRIVLPDRTLRWIAARGRRRGSSGGERDRLMGISVDVTERKRAEKALRDSEARLTAAINVAGLGFYALLGASREAHLDDRCRSLLGVPDDQIHRAREFWLEHVHAEDFERVIGLSRDMLEGSLDAVSVEYRYRHPRRGLIWLNQFSQVIGRTADGKLVEAVGVFQDITDLKQREREIQEANEFSRDILSSFADGVAIVDREGMILAVNDEWKRVALEKAGSEILAGAGVGTSYLEVCRCAGAHDVLDGIESVLSGERGFVRIEYSRLGSAGARWFQVRAMPLKRRTSGALITHTDISDRKNAEAELEKQRSQILHADRVAQTGVLTASLAHELNQPLAAILTNAQAGLRLMAGENPDVEELREILEDIVSDDKRAAAVIGGLRVMLRREGGERTRIGLADTIQDVLRLLHSEILGQSVQFQTHMEFDGPVLADRTQIQQVVLNLVMNAVEAMRNVPVSRRSLDVALTRSGPAEALVTVRDSGPGIPEDHREKMFQAFWTTKPQGIGVGLQISRSIVESHGGRLWFTDNPDHGATFCFTLPLSNGPGSAAK
jgi:PAS domain S-box-containing protein